MPLIKLQGQWPCSTQRSAGLMLLGLRPGRQPKNHISHEVAPPYLGGRGGVGLGWVGSRPRLVAYPRSAPPSLRDPTGRPYPGVRSQGLPDC